MEAADEPENGSDDDAENEPSEPVTVADMAAQAKGKKPAKVQAPEAKPIPEGQRALLDSPQDFGIWVKHPLHDGKHELKLHRFRKGKTPLSEIEHEACQLHPYVKDNGAEIIYRPVAPTKKG